MANDTTEDDDFRSRYRELVADNQREFKGKVEDQGRRLAVVEGDYLGRQELDARFEKQDTRLRNLEIRVAGYIGVAVALIKVADHVLK